MPNSIRKTISFYTQKAEQALKKIITPQSSAEKVCLSTFKSFSLIGTLIKTSKKNKITPGKCSGDSKIKKIQGNTFLTSSTSLTCSLKTNTLQGGGKSNRCSPSTRISEGLNPHKISKQLKVSYSSLKTNLLKGPKLLFKKNTTIGKTDIIQEYAATKIARTLLGDKAVPESELKTISKEDCKILGGFGKNLKPTAKHVAFASTYFDPAEECKDLDSYFIDKKIKPLLREITDKIDMNWVRKNLFDKNGEISEEKINKHYNSEQVDELKKQLGNINYKRKHIKITDNLLSELKIDKKEFYKAIFVRALLGDTDINPTNFMVPTKKPSLDGKTYSPYVENVPLYSIDFGHAFNNQYKKKDGDILNSKNYAIERFFGKKPMAFGAKTKWNADYEISLNSPEAREALTELKEKYTQDTKKQMKKDLSDLDGEFGKEMGVLKKRFCGKSENPQNSLEGMIEQRLKDLEKLVDPTFYR